MVPSYVFMCFEQLLSPSERDAGCGPTYGFRAGCRLLWHRIIVTGVWQPSVDASSHASHINILQLLRRPKFHIENNEQAAALAARPLPEVS